MISINLACILLDWVYLSINSALKPITIKRLSQGIRAMPSRKVYTRLISLFCLFSFAGAAHSGNQQDSGKAIGEHQQQLERNNLPNTVNHAYKIKLIDFCQLDSISLEPSHLIFGENDKEQLSGWNHIGKPKFESEFANISQGPSAIAYSPKKPLTRLLPKDESNNINAYPGCVAQQVFLMTLVKKYGNGSRKHANGIQSSLSNITYGELDKVRLYMKFDSTTSKIPTFAQLKERYSSILNEKELNTLYDPNLTMKLSFAATNTKDSKDFIGDMIIKVDSKYIDKWVLIEIDISQMSFYAGQWFKRLPKSLADNLDTKVSKFKITAEAYGTQKDPQKQGQTAKGLSSATASQWQAFDFDELYKELGIVIARLEVITK